VDSVNIIVLDVAGDLNTLDNDVESMKRSTKRLVKNAEILKVNEGKKVLEILESAETRFFKNLYL